jgi:hypothetical protein
MRPQTCHDGKLPDAIIKDFAALLDNAGQATHRMALYCGTQGDIGHRPRNITYISDEHLHPMEL